MAPETTDAELQNLLNQNLSQNEIAKRTGIPRSTLRRRLEKLAAPQMDTGTQNESTHSVHKSIQTPEQAPEISDELQEMLAWWRHRKHALQIEDDLEQETERKTYHVQKRYIEAIQRASDLEHVSITEIVNRAFAYYFNRAHE
jgi:response regulator of citrate/malate metabolism